MCARVGMVTGRGLVGALQAKFPRPVLFAVSLALVLANTINIGADLSGMAEAASLVTGLQRWLFVVLFAAAIAFATVKLPYRQIAAFLKMAGALPVRVRDRRDPARARLAGGAARLHASLGAAGIGMGRRHRAHRRDLQPVLLSSAAYAFAELFGWRHGLDQKIRRARAFYS